MRLYSGDEVGLIKQFDIETSISEGSDSARTTRDFVRAGRMDAKRSVLFMDTYQSAYEHNLYFARKDGSIECLDISESLVHKSETQPCFQQSSEPIGFQVVDDSVYSCDSTGTLGIFSLLEDAVHRFPLGSNLQRMRVHKTGVVAVGGNERELALYDFNSSMSGSFEDGEKITPLFKAKNVKNNWLDLRVACNITEIQYMDTASAHEVIVGTANKLVRLYDTRTARRPVVSAPVSLAAVKSICPIPGSQSLIFSDTRSNMCQLDLRKASAVCGKFKGQTGTVSHILYDEESASVVSGCSDRMVRLHSFKSRKHISTQYVKQRVNCILMDSVKSRTTDSRESESEGELWDEMPTVGEESHNVRVKRQKTD